MFDAKCCLNMKFSVCLWCSSWCSSWLDVESMRLPGVAMSATSSGGATSSEGASSEVCNRVVMTLKMIS